MLHEYDLTSVPNKLLLSFECELFFFLSFRRTDALPLAGFVSVETRCIQTFKTILDIDAMLLNQLFHVSPRRCPGRDAAGVRAAGDGIRAKLLLQFRPLRVKVMQSLLISLRHQNVRFFFAPSCLPSSFAETHLKHLFLPNVLAAAATAATAATAAAAATRKPLLPPPSSRSLSPLRSLGVVALSNNTGWGEKLRVKITVTVKKDSFFLEKKKC